MTIITRLFRLIRINFILARYSVDEIIFSASRFKFLTFFVYLNPFYWFIGRHLTRGERIRIATEKLGPIFVKAGQIISTRRDLIPKDIGDELAKLQDRVPPFCGKKARRRIEKALQCSINDAFTDFNEEPLASASIAQVHAARLMTGEEVVIKVLRPGIHKAIERDLDLLRTLARLANSFLPNAKQLKPKELVEEISQTLHDELDLIREAANASQLKRNFKNSRQLHVPKIYWDYSQNNVIVMERIHGIQIHNIKQLRKAGVNLNKLAENMIEVFFTQVFRDSFFHADLHPGNIFVATTNPNNPQIILVDFGIAGSLSHKDQRYLAENLIAFFNRDYQRVAELHIACGWLPPDTRVDQFEGAIRAVSEPIFGQPLKEISFGKLLLRLFQVAQKYQINIQPQLILLQKTIVSMEGLSRSLAPDLDVWSVATPLMEKWLKEQLGTKAFFNRIKENLPMWSEQFPEIPSMLFEVLKETKEHQTTKRFNKMAYKHHHKKNYSKTILAFISGVLITGAAMYFIK